MFELLDARDLCVLIFGLVYLVRPVEAISILLLVENLQTANLLVNRLHKLAQTLKVKLKLLDKVLSVFVERRIEQFFSDHLDLVRDSLFRLSCGISVGSEFSFKPLGKDVVLELDNV